MRSQYFPTYSTARNEIIDVILNLKGYVTQEELKNLTKVDTSNFALMLLRLKTKLLILMLTK